jgi:hypothetical protein
MTMTDYREYLGNAKIVFTLDKSLYFKGLHYNVIDHKVLDNGTLWYCGTAVRHTGSHKVMFSIIATISPNGTQSATVGKFKMD